jgi:tetratricopeptide (TPR) repeat protein
LGGVGKTQVALQLAYWVKENRPEYSIFWVPVLSDESFGQAYTEMAKKLAISPSAENEDLKESVRRHLSSERAGPWLLVLDNADDLDVLFKSSDKPGGIVEYLPESEDGLILFTTRSREVAVSVAGSDVVELHEMDSQEAISFLEKSLIRKDLLRDTAAAAELLDELNHLPLAITQAAAYLNTNQVSVAEYLVLLRGTEQDMIGLMSRTFRDSTRYKGSQNAVATTWLVSFDQILKSDSIAADLLSFISRIEPKAIPRSIMPDSPSKEQMVHAIGTLCAYGFVVKRGISEIFDMHGLVHMATRIWIEMQGRARQTTKDAIEHLAAVFPSDDYENRDLWREYLPHALRVLQRSTGPDIDERYDLYVRVGRCLEADGRIKEAVKCFEMCYEWRKGHFMEDHASRLASQHALAGAYREDGQVKKAVELLEHVVTVRARTLTENHPNRLASQHGLAVTYRADGQIKKAVELLEHVVAIEARTLTEDHPNRLASQHALAGAYETDGQVKKAVELLEHVVAVKVGTLVEDHPERLASQHALAGVYEADGQVKKAVELLEHVVTVRAKTLAENHPNRLASQHELARAYRRDGQIKKTVELLEYIVAVDARTLAEDHPSRLALQHVLAVAYEADGQVKKAVELLEHVVTIETKTLAENHFSRLTSQHELAKAYEADGQIKKAVELLEHVVTVEARTLTEDHPDRLASQHALAGAYETDGQIKKAVELLEHVVAVKVETLAEDHPDRLTSQHALAGAYEADGQVKKAVELLEHVVAVEAGTLAEDHPDRLASQHLLMYMYTLLAASPMVLADWDDSRYNYSTRG